MLLPTLSWCPVCGKPTENPAYTACAVGWFLTSNEGLEGLWLLQMGLVAPHQGLTILVTEAGAWQPAWYCSACILYIYLPSSFRALRY